MNVIDPVSNLLVSTIATAPSPASSGTTFVVTAGEGALFPDPATAGEYNLIIYLPDVQITKSNSTMVRVTGKSTDTFTVTRNTEGSNARDVVVGDKVAMVISAKTLTDIDTSLGTKLDKSTNITSIDDTDIANGEIAVFDLTNKSIETSNVTIATTVGEDDTTVPTSAAIATFVEEVGSNSFQIDCSAGTSDTYGVLGGSVDSSNDDFTVSLGAYVSGSLKVYLNGQLQTQGSGEDWVETTPASGTFAFATAPTTGDIIVATYLFSTGGTANADTLDGVHVSSLALNSEWESGWIDAGETWTYASADDPTYTFTISGDLTSKYSVGMKLKLTQTTVKYFIITAISYSSPNTTVTVYGGTDYDLANATITLPYYSCMKSPQGFPMSPAKWSVVVTDTSTREQEDASSGTYYNLGSIQISVPIGVWRLWTKHTARSIENGATAGTLQLWSGLSTSSNSVSDAKLIIWTATGSVLNFSSANFIEQFVTLATKTTYYLIARHSTPTGDNVLRFENSNGTCVITAVCTYL